MEKQRVHIHLDSIKDVTNFIRAISNEPDTFSIENHAGSRRVDAKSVIGVMYAMMNFGEEMLLVRDDESDTSWPTSVGQFIID